MKTINQIFRICLFFALSIGCSKDNIDVANPSSELAGKWKDQGIKGSLTIDIMGRKSTESLEQPINVDLLEFKNDGSITNSKALSAISNALLITKYSFSSKQLTFSGTESYTKKSINLVFNYSLNGNFLILSMDKELFTKNVESLPDIGPGSEFEFLKEIVPFVTEYKYEHTFEKQ
ncbi:MAG: hypothetical protein V4683_09875 [Bacteroidota bacterium]